MKIYNTEQLIEKVRQIGSFNDVDSEGKDDASIAEELNAVMYDELVPTMFRLNEEWFVRTVDVALTATENRYRVPTRAIGNALRDAWWTDGNAIQNLTLMNREDIPLLEANSNASRPLALYFEGEYIVLYPEGAAGTLKVAFNFRPGQLVLAADYRIVLTVDTTTGVVVTTSALPTAWTTADMFDIHSPESGAENRVWDAQVSSVLGSTLTFSSAIDGSVAGTRAIQVGDYVTLQNHAAIPGIPREMHNVLAQAAACRLLESDGDSKALEISQRTLARQLRNLDRVLGTRIKGKAKKIINHNSFLRTQRRGWGFR